MIDPHRVAEAILKAATEGGLDVNVGAMAKLDTTGSKLLPSLGDRLAAMQAHRQQRDVPAKAPEGALLRAGGGGQVYGSAG